ncbi:hypothetical protein KFK09_021126 [Dendrobium nobile]|uniref:Uncharacterized protein n=1 Tax=Dendrobium nobile TaxID=94219 RepID=A0A8T3APB3_DENNO|nr:hypothetical protein KFK09_021126 [Dendrobium nobile]
MNVGGAGIGAVAGALKGQTTETGIVRGAVIGSFTGVVVAVELLESCLQGLQGELLEKMAIFGSILNGKVFREWVSSALLIAYEEQVSTVETSYVDTSDLFDISRSKGLLLEMINKLPEFNITGLEFVQSNVKKLFHVQSAFRISTVEKQQEGCQLVGIFFTCFV